MRLRGASVVPSASPEAHPSLQRRSRRKNPKKLDELFHDTLKDIYFAEKKILEDGEGSTKRRAQGRAFKKHEAETEDQVGRLEHLFAAIDRAAKQDLRGHRRHC